MSKYWQYISIVRVPLNSIIIADGYSNELKNSDEFNTSKQSNMYIYGFFRARSEFHSSEYSSAITTSLTRGIYTYQRTSSYRARRKRKKKKKTIDRLRTRGVGSSTTDSKSKARRSRLPVGFRDAIVSAELSVFLTCLHFLSPTSGHGSVAGNTVQRSIE